MLGLAVLVAAGSFAYYKVGLPMWKNNKPPLLEEPKKKLPAFQPEGEMLKQGQAAAAAGGHVDVNLGAGEPVKASEKYAYEKNICPQGNEKFGCIQEFYQNLVTGYGVDIAFADVKQRFNEDPYVASTCHPIMHVIGYTASGNYKTVSEAYMHGDSFCWSGYYHGIMEGVIARIGPEKLPAAMDTICADIPGKPSYSFDYYNCVHGLGHGIMELGHDEVFNSLKLCDNLTGQWEQSSCYSGVYMENIIAAGKTGSSKYLKPEDPLYPCNAVEYKYKDQCYLGQTSYALQVTAYNYEKVFGLCAAVEEPFRATCNQSMGRDVANQAMHEPRATKTKCELAQTEGDISNCIIGAAKEIVSYYHSDQQAYDFCKLLAEPFSATCSNTVKEYYSYF